MIAESLKSLYDDEWKGYVDHEFVSRMRNGDLPIENFKFYLVQDSLYVNEMIKAVIRSAELMPSDMAFQILSAVILGRDKGMETHAYLENELGVEGNGRMTMTTYSYTRHLRYSSTIGWPQFLAAWIPCMWGYSEVGRSVSSSPNKYYRMWAEFYASKEYADRVSVILSAMDRFNGDITEIKDYFLISLKFEQRFWQAALEMESPI
ncbi:TenA family transcriptional regulator [Thermoplasma sp. Kam2015]|uniref:TenA family protein n=1 Tax=Thermoplasma sp. Kam2015 TaxID=2094122 RepID=UPI000D818B9D|nr:TenA family protein [Thermoplasma sp. Kam2015]PYB67502.1 TenA family transcriptional regulator [Thermoplasma sp. Kam2015]